MGALKTQDIPIELRTWWKAFQTASYRHDYARVFDDFVTMTIAQFGPPPMFDDWHTDAMRAYDRKEKDAFNEMFFEIFKIFHEQIEVKEKKFYDLFGYMYELLSSQGKKSSLGQFFTPECLVEMMVQMTQETKPGERKKMLDPACGSGRMLFISHVHAPGNFQYGVDIDQLCVKMTAMNMMLHGCVGEVVCGNGLALEHDWRFCLSINPHLHFTGVPSILKIEKEKSFLWTKSAEMKPQAPVKSADTKIVSQQLTIF